MDMQVILTAASFDKELWTSIGQAIALEGRGKHNNYMAQNDRLPPWTGVSFCMWCAACRVAKNPVLTLRCL